MKANPTAAGTPSSSRTRNLGRAAPVGERGADVFRRKDRVLFADLVNRVAGFSESLDTLNRNPGSRNHRFICCRVAVPMNLPDRASVTGGTEGSDGLFHIASHDRQRYFQHNLAGNNVLLAIRRGVVDDHASLED